MQDLTRPSVGDLEESLAKCEKQIGLLERIMRIEAEDLQYQRESGAEASIKQRLDYYDLQLRQEKAVKARILSAIAERRAQNTDETDKHINDLAEERAALEEADIIESFLNYFRRAFYGGGEFSEHSIRSGATERQYYEDILNQMFKDALIYKKRARELSEEFPDNARFAKLPSRISVCIDHIDRLDSVLNSLPAL